MISQSHLFDLLKSIATREREFSARDSEQLDASSVQARKRLRVLLAEDHHINQKVAARMVEKLGHHATVVGDGAQALAALDVARFDVVLMDIQMPVMDGFQAVATLRERELSTAAHLPVIALTAHAMKGDRERCLEAGFDGYVSKPLQAKELSDVLENLMGEPARPCGSNVSLDALRRTCNGDPEFMRELIVSYLETSPGLRSRIEEAIETGDSDRLAAEAHGWKGISQSLGFEEFASFCWQLEDAGRRQDLSRARAIFPSTNQAWKQLQPSLESLLKGNP
jgi:CheY-like chemotaxis protein